MSKPTKVIVAIVAVLVAGWLGFQLMDALVPESDGGLRPGISAKASKFTDVEVTNETQTKTLTVTNTSTFQSRVVGGGQVTSKTSVATSTLTAAEVCPTSVLNITPVSTTPTLTLPPTSTLFASSGGCLTTNGQYIDVVVRSITTSTILAAGTGGSLLTNASATVGADKAAWLRLWRISATNYVATMISED